MRSGDIGTEKQVTVSFLLRCYRLAGSEGVTWRVYVRHVQNGGERYFTCWEDAIAYIGRQLENNGAPAGEVRNDPGPCD